MGYYLRAFCVRQPPAITEVLTGLRDQNMDFKLQEGDVNRGRGEAGLRQYAVQYRAGRLPILVDVGQRTDPEIQEEIDEFVDLVKDEPPSLERRRVEDHLTASQFVVAMQVASEEMDDTSLEAAGALLSAYVQRCEGLVQADGEGFYDGDALLLALQ
jgi:hypothetical protein